MFFITFDLSNSQNFGIAKRRSHSQRSTIVSTVLSETVFLFFLDRYSHSPYVSGFQVFPNTKRIRVNKWPLTL